MKAYRASLAMAALAAALAIAGPSSGGERPMTDAKKADGLFAKQNWMEARVEFDGLFAAGSRD